MARKKIKVPSLRDIQKKFPGQYIASQVDESRMPWLPTRCLAFNKVTGGGIPFGKILELFGEESSGKTLLAYDFAYCAQYLGGIVLWVDAEQSFTNSWAEANGLDLQRVIVYRDTSIEKISDWIAMQALYWRSQLTHNEPILLVVDSISALDTDNNINSEMDQASADMGNRAKAIYKYFRIRNEMLYSLGITQVYINQLRKNLKAGMFEDPDCLHGDTPIPFVDGSSHTIKEIVENQIQGNVWSIDPKSGEWLQKPISGWVKKEPLETDRWYTIDTYGPDTWNGIISTTVTGNHKFLVRRESDTSNSWVFAKDLKMTDKLVSHTQGYFGSSSGLSFLKGTLIGDSSICVRKFTSASLHISDNVNPEYAAWKINKLSILPFKKYINGRGLTTYKSSYNVELKLMKDIIGNRDPLKVLEKNKVDWLTLAVWYMDDGHYYGDKRGTCCISISYKRTDISELSKVLASYGLSVRLDTRGKLIKLDKDSTEFLHSNICQYVPESMQYKLLPKYRGKYQDFNLEFSKKDYTLYLDIRNIREASDRKLRHRYKYDLTVEDTHNFLAGNVDNGIVVHNTTPGGKALAFYAHIRIGMYGGKQLTKKVNGKERKVGRITSIRTKKNKVAPPGPTLKGTPIYNNPKYVEVGIDRLHFLDEILIEEEIVEKSKAGVFTFKGKTLCRGAEKFTKLLADDDELRRKLIRKAHINTLGATKKLLESIETNLYPVDSVEGDDYEDDE